MGQIFEKHQSSFDPGVIIQLKEITMRDIFDCVDTIDKYYPQVCYLTFEQFDDIFGALLSNAKEIFDRLKEDYIEEYLQVHTFEALATLAMFSGETYEIKCIFIFRLFDFDLSNTLEQVEMVNTLQCVVRAMCKIVGLVIPSVGLLEQLAEVCFQMMDEDKDNHVDFEEFYEWTVHNQELQEFLLQYSGTQTYEYAITRMAEYQAKTEVQFRQWAKQFQTSNVIPASGLLNCLKTAYHDIDEQSVHGLFNMIIDYTLRNRCFGQEDSKYQKDLWAWRIDPKKSHHILNDLYIRKGDYLDILKAWNAYSIADVNNLSQISVKELKLLIWLYEEEEPDYFKINSELATIDSNKNRLIERIEWVEYLCSEEAMSRRQNTQQVIKKIFDNYDHKQLGFIEVPDIDALLRDTFKQQMKKLKEAKNIELVNEQILKIKGEFQKQMKRLNKTHFDWPTYYKLLLEASQTNNVVNKLLNLHD